MRERPMGQRVWKSGPPPQRAALFIAKDPALSSGLAKVQRTDFRLRQRIPWQIRMGAKIIASRLPLSYRFWSNLSLFKHGDMDRPKYAFGVFCKHFDRVRFARKDGGGFVGLELGPGDSLFSALIAKVFGASEVYLVDVAPFAWRGLPLYLGMVEYLRQHGFSTSAFENCRSLEELLASCSAHYFTNGLNSLRKIPAASVDFVWSHGVLQSIRRSEFLPTLRELRRIQRGEGIGSHSVELKDCLGCALNNLRFREEVWESDFISKSSFYTNRIRYIEMLKLFGEAGFEAQPLDVQRWETLPTPRSQLALPFRDLPEEELKISAFDVILS